MFLRSWNNISCMAGTISHLTNTYRNGKFEPPATQPSLFENIFLEASCYDNTWWVEIYIFLQATAKKIVFRNWFSDVPRLRTPQNWFQNWIFPQIINSVISYCIWNICFPSIYCMSHICIMANQYTLLTCMFTPFKVCPLS